MIKHPTQQHLASYLDGETDERGGQRIWQHISACPDCRMTLAKLQAIRQAIRATAPPMPSFDKASSFVAALNYRIRKAPPSVWRSVCFAAPIALTLAGLSAQEIAWAIFGGDLLQRVGVVPQVGPEINAWAVQTATAPIWQRIVYEPLGLSEQDVALAVSNMILPMQNDTLRPIWAGLIMALPLTLLFGVGVLALSWLVCWSGAGRRR